jgi:hypothetical protein
MRLRIALVLSAIRASSCHFAAMSPKAFAAVSRRFSRCFSNAGDLLMLGKPHETRFPEETFTVKDGFGPNSEREGLNPASGSYRDFHRQPVLLAGDSHP